MKTLLKTPNSSLESIHLLELVPHFDEDALKKAVKNLPFKKRPKIVVYNRECEQPRDVLFLSDASSGYNYSKQSMPSVPFDESTKSSNRYLRKLTKQ